MKLKNESAAADVARAQRARRIFRNRLVLTTVLTVAPFMGYGRQAEAACVAPPLSSTYTCSGAGGAQMITADNAAVTTVTGFGVNTDIGNGITITGDGALSYIDINATTITSTDANGLEVVSTGNDVETDGSVTIATNGTITGYDNGIYARNEGAGNLDIKVYGHVTGVNDDGIYARNAYDTGNGVDLTITTGAQSVITAGSDGIAAENYGSGKLEIIANGTVIADNDGVEASNSGNGTDLIVTSGAGSTITAGSDGIDAEHSGAGNLLITVNGKVTGFDRGIESDNAGLGYTNITVGAGGILEGDSAAINAESNDGQDIYITNNGIVRNVSGESDAIAIETYGGDTIFENHGNLTGVVRFNEDDDDIENYGVWNTAGGRNEFGLDYDVVQNAGTILAANDASAEETTEFVDLEVFDNDGGLVSLADGAVGDTLRLSGEFETFDPLTYYADNGRLAVDAVLADGPAGEADVLEIDGDVDEAATTIIKVNVVDAGAANVEGIPVVKVLNEGEAHAGNFVLDGPVQAGLFSWDLRYDFADNWYELYADGVGIGAYELAGGLTGAQDIWHQTTGTLAQRQADLRPLLGGTQVTPVADFAEPVAPTAAGRVGPGFWFTALGGYLERDAEQDGFTLDRKQSIYGGLAGFDFATEGAGDTWLLGVFGGYLSSTLKFSETNSKWTYDGPTVGAYATYLNDAFYADVTVKADFLSISIDPDDLAPAADDSDTDGVNLGGRIDAGYKIGAGQGLFVEPQATLAVLNTNIDDTEVFGSDVDFDNETSVKGRLGLRLGYDQTASNALVYSSDITASVWQEFNGSNSASISTAGLADFGVSDDTIETLGDISLGFGVTAPEGWSGFLRANYQFAEDFDAITGNAGLRYAW